jgi:hypothetical protein
MMIAFLLQRDFGQGAARNFKFSRNIQYTGMQLVEAVCLLAKAFGVWIPQRQGF